MIDLFRCVMRLPGPMVDSLDRIANEASKTLRCEVSRAAVVRAAIEVWLEVIERGSREQLIARIRASTMKRGRKRQGERARWLASPRAGREAAAIRSRANRASG